MRALILAALMAAFLFLPDGVQADNLNCAGTPCHWRNYNQPSVIRVGDNLPPEYDVALDFIVPAYNAGQDEYELVVVPGRSIYGDDPIPPSDGSYKCGWHGEESYHRIEVCRACPNVCMPQFANGTEFHELDSQSHILRAEINIREGIAPPDPNPPCCFPAGQFSSTLCHEMAHALGIGHYIESPPYPCTQEFPSHLPDQRDFDSIIEGAHGGDCPDLNGSGYVDTGDIGMVSQWFGQAVPPAPWVSDLQNSLYVDSGDLGIVTGQFGRMC